VDDTLSDQVQAILDTIFSRLVAEDRWMDSFDPSHAKLAGNRGGCKRDSGADTVICLNKTGLTLELTPDCILNMGVKGVSVAKIGQVAQ
jgi:hypothetical protein